MGYAGASTVMIASAAKTKQPLLYYHYGSKQNLWESAVDFAYVELSVAFDSIRETAVDMSPVDTLKLMLRLLNRFAIRNPQHIDILRQEMGSNSEQTEYLLKKYLAPMYRQINEMATAAAEAGEIKPMPPQFLSSLLFGATTHFFTAGPVMDEVYALDTTDLEQGKQHGDWLVDVIFSGLAITKDD